MNLRGALAKLLAVTMAVGLLVLVTATTGSAFAHDIQHAGHHSAAMHGKGICAWMCAAGQAMEEIPLPLAAQASPVESVSPLPFLSPSSNDQPTSASRAPPFA